MRNHLLGNLFKKCLFAIKTVVTSVLLATGFPAYASTIVASYDVRVDITTEYYCVTALGLCETVPANTRYQRDGKFMVHEESYIDQGITYFFPSASLIFAGQSYLVVGGVSSSDSDFVASLFDAAGGITIEYVSYERFDIFDWDGVSGTFWSVWEYDFPLFREVNATFGPRPAPVPLSSSAGFLLAALCGVAIWRRRLA